MGPPIEVGSVPDLGSLDDRPEFLPALRDRGHDSTGVMDTPKDSPIAELVEPVRGRDEDSRHLLIVSPRRGIALDATDHAPPVDSGLHRP